MLDPKTLVIIALALLLAWTALTDDGTVAAQDGGTVPTCATATRKPTRTPWPFSTRTPTPTGTPTVTPTATATPTIGEPAVWQLDWLPLVQAEGQVQP